MPFGLPSVASGRWPYAFRHGYTRGHQPYAEGMNSSARVSWGRREWMALAVLVLVAVAGIGVAQFSGPAAVVPSVVMVVCVAGIAVGWTRTWGWVVGVTVVALEMSVVALIISFEATALYPHGQTESVRQITYLCSVVNELALMVLIALVVRKAASITRAAVVVISVSAVMAVWVLPFLDPVTPANVLFAVTLSLLRSLAAVGAGVHLRSVDALRIRAVTDARRAQRLDLARDLHDFIAHDAQLVASHDLGAALTALQRIEHAGINALASMDNTVHMLHDADADEAQDVTTRTPLPSLADLPKLTDQFSVTSPARVALHIDPAALDGTPREITTTAYRIVVEALTNIRRHAPNAATVDIVITADPAPARPALRVTVTNDCARAAARGITRADQRGGLGLLGLADRVHALGGTLNAGPYGSAGWRVTAVLPLASRLD
jgi:signal transduction histidine kinase